MANTFQEKRFFYVTKSFKSCELTKKNHKFLPFIQKKDNNCSYLTTLKIQLILYALPTHNNEKNDENSIKTIVIILAVMIQNL